MPKCTSQVNLKVFRKALRGAGISLASFALNSSVSRVHLYKVLHGERMPGPVLRSRIEKLVREFAA